MRCLATREQLSAFIDNELDSQEVRALNAHLEGCTSCRQELEQLRAAQMLLREVAFAVPAPKPSVHFSARVMQAIAEDDLSHAPQARGPFLAEPALGRFWEALLERAHGWLRLPRYALSMASLALAIGVLTMVVSGGGVKFAASWFGPQRPTLTTVYKLPQIASLKMPRETDLEEALREFAYHSSGEPTLEGGAWVALAQVRYGAGAN
ncbi:MAG: zf-HC2 domain-containing protein [Candidatus Tectomicrobia bacterium]|nr:zf-HC2 domain-containing protein [Candidatus Tectomicrobia bacterium]